MVARSDRSRRAYDVLSTAFGATLVAAIPVAQWAWVAAVDAVGLDALLPSVVLYSVLPAAMLGLCYVPWGLLGHGPRRVAVHVGLIATTAAVASLFTRGWLLLG